MIYHSLTESPLIGYLREEKGYGKDELDLKLVDLCQCSFDTSNVSR